MKYPFPTQGLYAITTESILHDDQLLLDAVHAALHGGVVAVQYRNKHDDWHKRHHQASILLPLCHRFKAPLIINDDIQLAHEVHADGVHLGRDDEGIADARALLGEQAIVGISCYGDMVRAIAAQAAGASYVAFGCCFASHTKPSAPLITLDLFDQAHQQLTCPVVAIGGITPQNGGVLLQTGAHVLAVAHGLFGASDIGCVTKEYVKLWGHAEHC